MASPPAKKKPPTTISDLDQDTVREILFRLPSLPSVVRTALSCRAFLGAVRSSPAFRRRFRALHPPPLLGLFLSIEDAVVPFFVPLRRRPDPDLAAAVCGADFFLTRLPVPEDDKEGAVSVPVPVPVPEDEGDAVSVPVPEDDDEDAVSVGEHGDEDAVSVPEGDDEEDAVFQWSICDCRGGFVLLCNWSTEQMAVYNPLTRTLDLLPLPPRESRVGSHVDFHILA